MTANATNPAGGPLHGRFWLAGAREQIVTGLLTLGSEGPRVELDEALTSPFELEDEAALPGRGVVRRLTLSLNLSNEPLTVHGLLEPDDRHVTLVDVTTVRREHEAESMHARYAVLNGHIDGRQQRYSRMRLRAQHLDEWASTQIAPHSVSLNGGGSLDIERTSDGVWLRIVDLPDLSFREMDRRLLTPLSSLLTLAVGSGCPPMAVDIATGAGDPWLPLRASWLKLPPEQAQPAETMLAPLAVLGLDCLATWLRKVEKLVPLPPVVAAAVAAPGRSLETEVLELTTVAEGLHHRLFPHEVRMSDETATRAQELAFEAVAGQGDTVSEAVKAALQYLKELSYPQRLRQLAEHAVRAMPGVAGVYPNRWKNEVVESRHNFAHRFSGGFLDDDLVSRYLTVRESLRWLLTGVLLLEAGMPEDLLAKRFLEHQPYQLFLQQARTWLPKVYVQDRSA